MAAKAGRLQIQLALEVAELRRDVASVNNELKRASSGWQKSISGVGSAIKGAFIGGAILGAVQQFSSIMSGIVEDMGRITDESAKLGDSAENFQRLEQAAGAAGVSMDTIVSASNRLQKNLGAIATGGGKDAAEALRQLGLTAKDLEGLSTTDQLVKVAGALGQVQDKARQATAGSALFSKGWVGLLPIIGQGEQALRDAMDAAVVASDEAVAAGDAFGDAMLAMQSATRAFIAEALVPILPAFTALAGAMKDATARSKEGKAEFSGWETVAKLAAKALAVMVGSFRLVATAVTAAGEAIGVFVAAAVENLSTLADAALLTRDPRNLFNPKVWKYLSDQASATQKNVAQSFTDIGIEAAKSAGSVAQFYTEAFAAIDAAKVEVPTPTGGGTEGDTGATTANTAAVKDNTQARKDRNDVERAWQALIDDAADLFKIQVDQEAHLISLERDLQAERMRTQGITEEAIRQWRLNIDNATEYVRAVSDAEAAISKQAEATAKVRSDAERAREEQRAEMEGWANFAAMGISEIFSAMSEGADAATEAVKRLLVELLATIAAQQTLKWLQGFATPAARGMAFAMGGARMFAQGGIVSSPTAFTFGGGNLGVMGEAGPEAIMPLKRGPDGRLGVAGGGNVQVFNYSGGGVSVQRDQNNIKIMVDQVRSQVANDIARGGNMISGALERAYRVRR